MRRDSSRAWRELLFNGSFMDRMPDIGIVDARGRGALGVVGPAARAAGVADDVRASSPRLAYEGFEPAAPGAPPATSRRDSNNERSSSASLDILDRLLAGPIDPPPPRRGAERRSGRPRREPSWGDDLHRRARREPRRPGPAPNRLLRELARVAYAAAGNLLPDFPLINKSFELCYACADR